MITRFYMNGLVGIDRRALIKMFIKILGMICRKISHLLSFHIDNFYNLPFVNLQAEPFFRRYDKLLCHQTAPFFLLL